MAYRRRTEFEIIDDQIAESRRKLDKNMSEVAAAKKNIAKLEREKDKKFADSIAKACREKKIPLEKVLQWVNEQSDAVGPTPAPDTPNDVTNDGTANKPAGRKPARKRAAVKKPATKKAAPKRAAKSRKPAPTKSEAPVPADAPEPPVDDKKDE